MLALFCGAIDGALVTTAYRNHHDKDFGVAHFIYQTITDRRQLDLIAILRTAQSRGGNVRCLKALGQFFLKKLTRMRIEFFPFLKRRFDKS